MTAHADPDRPGALAAIGNTPVVRLAGIVEPGMGEVWVKLEAANPTGSREGRRVATIQVDSGLKYLRGEVYA